MKKYVIIGMAICIVLLSLSVSYGIELSADMIMKGGGQTTEGKMYMNGMKTRVEMTEGVMIYRPDKNVMWMLQPGEKTYIEMMIDKRKMPRSDSKAEGEVSRKFLSKEKVNGYPTKKYEVTVKEGGSTTSFYQWVSTDLEFPVKTAATDGSWSQEYKNIKKRNAPDRLFEVPGGYQKMTMPGIGGGMMSDESDMMREGRRKSNDEDRNQEQQEEESTKEEGWKSIIPKMPWK